MQLLLSALALVAAPQTNCPAPGPCDYTLTYPTGLPWDALRPQSASNPLGTPLDIAGAWNGNAEIGDIDGDGDLDVLYVIEQRLLLAVAFDRNVDGMPINPTALWAVFDPNGRINKAAYGYDNALLWDIDGDGLLEVAYVATDGNGDDELRIIEDFQTLSSTGGLCNTSCSLQLGNDSSSGVLGVRAHQRERTGLVLPRSRTARCQCECDHSRHARPGHPS